MKTIIINLILIFMTLHYSSKEETEITKQKILNKFEKKVMSDKRMGDALLLIHSDSLNIHWKTVVSKEKTSKTDKDRPYHFASIGKTITSVMISILYEKGLIDFEDKICDYLDTDILEGLHVYKGTDYSGDILVRQLLNHTSGIADYFSDKSKKGIRLADLAYKEPDRSWTPVETINWVKQNLKPKFAPGNGFHYSDTNYQLLGLIIEKITGKPLHKVLREYIFEPLQMSNTWQYYYSEPEDGSPGQIVDLYYKGINLSKAKSISMDWAGGGIASTSEDMLKFIKALVNNKIIKKETFDKMKDWARFGPGIRYGYGIMNFRIISMPGKYEIWGNSGSIGAFMYYNPSMDVYMIGSFHKWNCQRQPIMFILKTLRRINKSFIKN